MKIPFRLCLLLRHGSWCPNLSRGSLMAKCLIATSTSPQNSFHKLNFGPQTTLCPCFLSFPLAALGGCLCAESMTLFSDGNRCLLHLLWIPNVPSFALKAPSDPSPGFLTCYFTLPLGLPATSYADLGFDIRCTSASHPLRLCLVLFHSIIISCDSCHSTPNCHCQRALLIYNPTLSLSEELRPSVLCSSSCGDHDKQPSSPIGSL